MNLIETDVIICGAGISGLLMAKSLTNIGIKVACIEKYKRQKDNTEETDLRSTALLDPAISFFKEIGLWEKFEKVAQPLNSLVICNLDPKTEEINSSCYLLKSRVQFFSLLFLLLSITISPCFIESKCFL